MPRATAKTAALSSLTNHALSPRPKPTSASSPKRLREIARFTPDNIEVVVKVLDGRPLNGKFWVFFSSLTTEQYTLTVTDSVTGAQKSYVNAQGQMSSAADTNAF